VILISIRITELLKHFNGLGMTSEVEIDISRPSVQAVLKERERFRDDTPVRSSFIQSFIDRLYDFLAAFPKRQIDDFIY